MKVHQHISYWLLILTVHQTEIKAFTKECIWGTESTKNLHHNGCQECIMSLLSMPKYHAINAMVKESGWHHMATLRHQSDSTNMHLMNCGSTVHDFNSKPMTGKIISDYCSIYAIKYGMKMYFIPPHHMVLQNGHTCDPSSEGISVLICICSNHSVVWSQIHEQCNHIKVSVESICSALHALKTGIPSQ